MGGACLQAALFEMPSTVYPFPTQRRIHTLIRASVAGIVTVLADGRVASIAKSVGYRYIEMLGIERSRAIRQHRRLMT
jgi:hypothetical protein